MDNSFSNETQKLCPKENVEVEATTRNSPLLSAEFFQNKWLTKYLNDIEVKLLETAAIHYKKDGELQYADIATLSLTFGNTLENAMELVDNDRVSVLKSPSNRILINVRGSSQTFWIPPGVAVCQCLSYTRGFAAKKPICKHIIAAHFVLTSICRSEYQDISDAELTQVYKKYFQAGGK